MKQNILLSLLIIILSTNFSYASTDEISVTRERTFVGEALYGFMNGGSELFLEYGFKELRALDVTYKNQTYSIEIYTMPTPEDAFGIYSLHTFKCIEKDTLFDYACFSRYQLQAIKGDTYVSIVYEEPFSGINNDAVELFHYFTNDMSDLPVNIPTELKVSAPISGYLKYMKGAISATNNLSDILPMLDGVNYSLWYYEPQNSEYASLLITAQNAEEFQLLKERFSGGKFFETSLSVLIELTEE